MQSFSRFTPTLLCCRVEGVSGKRELGLGIVGMNQKRSPPIDIALQQAHAFMRGIPALDHDVVQLIAQKRINHGFVFAADFKKVRQRAHRSQAAAQGIRLQQLAHRVGGIAVLADERLQRVAPPGQRSHFGAQAVTVEFGGALFAAPRLGLRPQGGQLGFETLQLLGDGLELERSLSAL